MEFQLGYGKRTMMLTTRAGENVRVLQPRENAAEAHGAEEIVRALRAPIGSKRIGEIVRPGEKIAVITSDITRPMPSALALPPLLCALGEAGIPDSDVTIVFALGSHRGHTEEEKKRLVGEDVYARVRCIDSDEHDCVRVGVTSSGTPVDLFTPVVRADRRICLGNIEYHYFAGYSGGAKALMPGVSTREAIAKNHRFMVDKRACAGTLDGPVRRDIDEVCALIRIDFILNVVLDEHKRLCRAFAGDPIAAHRAGCTFLDTLYMLPLAHRAEIVIASPGGYPKDINLYQAQKALYNAARAVADGGVLILCASCKEGLGEAHFEEWMRAYTPEYMIEEIQHNFILGAHKAAAIALVLARARIYLVSDLDPQLVRAMHFEPFAAVQDAYDAARARMGADAEALVIPYASASLPMVQG